MRRICATLTLSLLVTWPAPASAVDAGLLPRMERLTTHYHEDPARLDAGRAELEAAVKSQPSVAVLVMLAQISYVWGDIRGTTSDAKVQAYERGRQVADLERHMRHRLDQVRIRRAVPVPLPLNT